jgi:hypothetical protein
MYIVRRKNSLLNDCSNSFAICYTTIFAGDLGVGVISKLLLHVLTSLEDVKHTMRSHSTMLHALMRQTAGSSLAASEVPVGLNFPLKTSSDVDDAEAKLNDAATNTALVSLL